jgi:hypothetical protein
MPVALDERLMLRRRTLVLALLVLGACHTGERRVGNGEESAPFVQLTQAFLTAAARSDQSALLSMATDSAAVLTVNHWQDLEPAVIEAARHRLEVWRFQKPRNHAAAVVFRFPYQGRVEELGISFTERGTTWLVHRLGFPKRR